MSKEMIEKLREASYSASHGEMADLLQEAADALEAKAAPVAYITGQFAGRCVIEAINRAAVLPTGMALYATPQPSAVSVVHGLDADDVRAACQNAIEVFAEEENAEQRREVAEYMREVLLADLDRAAPQPSAVSGAITMADVMRAWEYAEDHPHKYLRGTTNWCAAVAHSLNQRNPSAPATVQGDAVRPLYTCIGKGGEYHYLGTAIGAGDSRGELVEVYQDENGQLYHRTPEDFMERMGPIAAARKGEGE